MTSSWKRCSSGSGNSTGSGGGDRWQFLLAIKKGRAARSALIASTMHRSSRQASRAAVMKAVAADLIREQRRVISEVVRVPHGDRLYDGPARNASSRQTTSAISA